MEFERTIEEGFNKGIQRGNVEANIRDPPGEYVRLRPSQFNGIPATVFFEYPAYLLRQRDDVSSLELLGKRKLRFQTYWERNCIKNAFLRAGFERSDKKCTAYWSKHMDEAELKNLNCLQKINHFPESWCIGRKDRLLRTITTMKRLHGAQFDFHPDGFILPQERDALIRHIQTEPPAKGKKV